MALPMPRCSTELAKCFTSESVRSAMWSAGIAWNTEGYELACVCDDGRTTPTVQFRANDVHGIVQYLADIGGTDADADAAVVVDSTNGLLDGPLREVGLCVLRADPW